MGVLLSNLKSEVWISPETSEKNLFRRVCLATLDWYSDDPYIEVTVLGCMIDAFGSNVSVVALTDGSQVLAEPFTSYLGSGYRRRVFGYTVFDLRPFKRRLQQTASSVFGSLDTFSMTEFIANRLKRAERRNWMSSCPAVRRAILANDPTMPHLVDFVANIISVWPLIVSYLKETGHKDDGDSLVVTFSFFFPTWLYFELVAFDFPVYRRKRWMAFSISTYSLA